MKRLISLALLMILLVTLPLNTLAAERYDEQMTTYFEDGSYLVETIEEHEMRASGQSQVRKPKHSMIVTVKLNGKRS